MERGTEILSDEDRFNIFLQLLMRCCVKVMRKLLSRLVQWLGYSDVDRFLSSEKAHLQMMPYASSPKSQAILYPGTPTDIKLWDLSLLNCVFTQIQRKIILNEFGNPIDHVLVYNRPQVIATPVGTAYAHKLYPASGRPTDINKWPMSVCSCLLSVLSPKPQTLLVRIAESLDDIRELRNRLCHPEDPAMTLSDYERHMLVLKTFIDAGLAYLGDEAFEAETKKDMDDIENGKLKTYLLIDHRHLQRSYHNDIDIIQRLDNIEKAVKELPIQGELNLLVFFGQLPREQKELLYASYIETFIKCLENNIPEAVEDEELKHQITLASCMAWKYLENPFEGRHVRGVRRKCLEVKIAFDNVLLMWRFIKDYLYGRLESAFEPMQTLLRTQKQFEHLEITLAISDLLTALMQIGQGVETDVVSVMFLLEMMFQKSDLRLDKSMRTRKMESDELEVTQVENTEPLSVVGSKLPSSEEVVFNKSDQKARFTVPLQPRERFFEEHTGEMVQTLVKEETETPIEEFTLDEAGKKVNSLVQEETETPIVEYTDDEAGKKVKAMILDERKKHINELSIDESGEVKPLNPRRSMVMYSTSESESKKEQVSYYCEPCLQDKIKVNCEAKCKDCDEMLCADCARVHRNSKMSRNHIMIGHQPDDLISLKFKRATPIQVKSPSDQVRGSLSAVLLLPNDRLLLADCYNKKVMLVDLLTNDLVSEVSVPGDEMDMCLLAKDRVAVSLGIPELIHFIETQEQLSLDDSIEVDGICLGIGYHNDRLIVSYDSGKLEIMDMSGKVIKKIDSDDKGQSVFGLPCCLTVVCEGQKPVLYVSDNKKNTITKLDMDLNILQIFQNRALREPTGITAVRGQLIICGESSNNIVFLDLWSSKITQLLRAKDGIQVPLRVCHSQQQNKLFVICGNHSAVSVYDITNKKTEGRMLKIEENT